MVVVLVNSSSGGSSGSGGRVRPTSNGRSSSPLRPGASNSCSSSREYQGSAKV